MGFEMDISLLVSHIKECFGNMMPPRNYLEQGKIQSPGILFTFDFRVNDSNDSEESGSIESCKLVHLLFVYPHATFIAEKEHLYEPSDFKMTSNHESCYRSDGIWSPLSKIYFDMCESINKTRKKRHQKTMAPIQMRSHAYIWNMKTVMVDLIPDPENPSDGYWKKIGKIENLKKS